MKLKVGVLFFLYLQIPQWYEAPASLQIDVFSKSLCKLPSFKHILDTIIFDSSSEKSYVPTTSRATDVTLTGEMAEKSVGVI